MASGATDEAAAEAEDVLQDAWLRWQSADHAAIVNPAAYLTTVTTRLAINVAASARVRRETYVGPWLPEPVDTSGDPALGAERAEALETAVLLLLERLTPVERAAYVLHEAFGYPHRQIAEVLDVSEANARQLVHRAKSRLGSRPASRVDPTEHRRMLEAFISAARRGDLSRLEEYLTEDVVARADGGGRVHASRKELVGVSRVILFLGNVYRKNWSDADLRIVEANGRPALLVQRAGEPLGLINLELSERGIEDVYLQVNPDKLTGFGSD
jgi:RNA polymerase sigma-70 factor (ECF subfamily)